MKGAATRVPQKKVSLVSMPLISEAYNLAIKHQRLLAAKV